MVSGKVKRFRLEPQDKKTKVPKLMLGNFFSNYQLLKKKRNSSKKKERVLICQEKKKNFLCESDWYWRSSKLASRFQTKKSLSNQNLPYIMLKTSFPFLYANTSLDTKTFVY